MSFGKFVVGKFGFRKFVCRQIWCWKICFGKFDVEKFVVGNFFVGKISQTHQLGISTCPEHVTGLRHATAALLNKNNTDLTSSCPRGWRLSTITGALLRKPPETHGTITALYRIDWAVIILRDGGLSNSECNFFKFGPRN